MTNGVIGILGGTFDPVHFGHLRLAQEVAEALDLQQVRFMPGGTPPHREMPKTPAADRVAMVSLAIKNNALFALDERETRRTGPSYSFDTLYEVRAEIGPARPLVLIMGADAFLAFNLWHRWRDIFSLAHIAVAHRPGAALAAIKDESLASEFAQRRADETQALRRTPAGSIVVVPITALDISATAIRTAVRAGRSTRYLLPNTVIAYIESKHLFLKEK
ncbi:MAG TPA: nicotinate-nucleotide adenylyltransferase [Burkholderiales bacterium]|nr:nicotinate-nucleotide adenylyltransferase [Burkholderiales bacterium]